MATGRLRLPASAWDEVTKRKTAKSEELHMTCILDDA